MMLMATTSAKGDEEMNPTATNVIVKDDGEITTMMTPKTKIKQCPTRRTWPTQRSATPTLGRSKLFYADFTSLTHISASAGFARM